MGNTAGRIAVLAIAAAVSGLFFLDLCDWVFQCGCQAPWAGAAQACNIHQPSGPHCPWCAAGWLVGGVLPFSAILATQTTIAFAPLALPWMARLALCLLAFPVVGLVVGQALALATGYRP